MIKHKKTSLSCFLALMILWSPSLHAQEKAKMADSFVESIGINVKLGYLDTPYAQFDSVKSKLTSAGIRYYREGLTSESELLAKQESLADAGIKMVAIVHPDSYKSISSDVSVGINALLEGYNDVNKTIVALEGPNETDIWPITYKGLAHPESIIQYSKDFYNSVKTSKWSNLPVLAPSYSNPWNYSQIKSCYGDFNNIHPYQGARWPGNTEDGQSLPFYMNRVNVVVNAKPVWATETGNYTTNAPDKDHIWFTNVSEMVQGKYMLRTYLTFFNGGIVKTFVHMLGDYYNNDSWCEARFGICRSDWSPKPAYTGLKNLILLLQDQGADFETGTLNYKLFGQTSDIKHTLLQKRDGTFFLILWREKSSWDYNAVKEIVNSTASVKIKFAEKITEASTFLPLITETAGETFSAADSLMLQVPDHPIVVKIKTGYIDPVGLTEPAEQLVHKLLVYPNPANDMLNIELYSKTSKQSQLVVLDMAGKIKYTEKLSLQPGENMLKLVTGSFEQGVYLIKVDGFKQLFSIF